MQLRKIKYWKTKKIEEFFVFMAKIVYIDGYNPNKNNGNYKFEAEYYIEYPLSESKRTVKGKGIIYHNTIPFLNEKPIVNTVITLMARPNDLEKGINWEINQDFVEPLSQSIIDFISDI